MAVKCTNTSDLLNMEASNGAKFKCQISVKPLKLTLKVCAVVPQRCQKTLFYLYCAEAHPVTPSLAASHSQALFLFSPLSSQSYATCARPKDVIKTLIYSWLQQLENMDNTLLLVFFFSLNIQNSNHPDFLPALIRAVHTFCPVATCLGINLEMAKSSEF